VNDKRRFHPPAVAPADGGGGNPLVGAAAHALATGADSRAVVSLSCADPQKVAPRCAHNFLLTNAKASEKVGCSFSYQAVLRTDSGIRAFSW
jgi:hypothetical protein